MGLVGLLYASSAPFAQCAVAPHPLRRASSSVLKGTDASSAPFAPMSPFITQARGCRGAGEGCAASLHGVHESQKTRHWSQRPQPTSQCLAWQWRSAQGQIMRWAATIIAVPYWTFPAREGEGYDMRLITRPPAPEHTREASL